MRACRARTHRATRFVTVATAVTREARNGDEFVRLLHETASLEAHVVSGREEARLIYLGLLSRVHVQDRALVIDIGGGSTGVALGGATGADVVESVSLGAIRLTMEKPQPDRRRRYAPWRPARCTTACRAEPLTRTDLRAAAGRLGAMSAEERRRTLGLTPARAHFCAWPSTSTADMPAH